MPADCDGLAQRVPLPPVSAGDDARKSLGRHRAAVVEANNRLDATRACAGTVREDFRAGK